MACRLAAGLALVPADRFDACLQFRHREGFDQVVVGAELQSLDFVRHRSKCRQNQDRCLDPLPANLLQYDHSRFARQNKYQKDEVEFLRTGLHQSLCAIFDPFAIVPRFGQTLLSICQ